jgi:6-phospho-3-hexuloisomerase
MKTAMEYSHAILTELDAILSHVDRKQTEKLADLVLETRKSGHKAYCAGAGRSLLMIRSFAMRMMHMGLRSYVVGETATPAIEKDDLIVFASGSGETGQLVVMIKKAKKAGARVAVITRSPESTLAKEADLVVLIPIEYGTAGLQPNGSTFEQSLLILSDALTLRIIEKGHLLKKGQDINSYIMTYHANLE